MSKPLIGISATTTRIPGFTMCINTYISAVTKAGGVPIILPHGSPDTVDAILAAVDGVILTGGGDCDPKFYNESPPDDLIRGKDPVRDAFEYALGTAAIKTDIPYFGVCRGMQWLNVFRGGTLHADLHAAGLPHERHKDQEIAPDYHAHHVIVEPGTKLHAITQSQRFAVNSRHHQAVNRLGDGLVISAHSDDGVVEAIEDPSHPFMVGLQWHPEDMSVGQCEFAEAMFDAFVHAAKAYQAKR